MKVKNLFYKVMLVSLGLAVIVELPAAATASSLAWAHHVTRVESGISVNWDDKEEAIDYTVIVNRDGVKSEPITVEQSEYVDTNTLPSVKYSYTVAATVPVDPVEPDTPEEPVDPEEGEPAHIETTSVELFTSAPFSYGLAKLSASAKLSTFNSISLSYTKVNGVSQYEIQRSTKKTSGFKKIATTDKTSHLDKSLAINKTYYYKVRGIQKTTNKTFYTNWSSTLSARTALGKTTLKRGKVTYNSVNLSWTKSQGATKYKVYRSTHKTKKYKAIATVSGLSYTNKSLKTGTTYYYKVVPYRGSIKGSTTKVISAKPALGKSNIYKANLKLGETKVTWSKVSGATGYNIYRATSKTGKHVYIGTTKSTSYTNKKLGHNKAYYYKVKAYRTVSGKKVYGGTSSSFKVVTPRKASQYRFTKDTYLVLETNGYGYYSVCASTRCNWSYDENDIFDNKAYVFVPAGYYLTFESPSKSARIIDSNYYYNTQKTSFTKAGHYLVGFDLKPGNYKLTSSKYYYYSVCYEVYCDWGNGYDENDLLGNGGTRYITLYEGDFLTINGSVKGVRY